VGLGRQTTTCLYMDRSSPQETRESEFKEFTDKVMTIAYSLLHDASPPRISPKYQKLLQRSPDTKVGDWFLYEYYTILRGYAFEEEPYKLPAFLTPRVFAMEFIRQ